MNNNQNARCDLADASEALVAWFKHQNINTDDAMVIMCRMIAVIIVENTESFQTMRDRVATIAAAVKNYSLCAWATKT